MGITEKLKAIAEDSSASENERSIAKRMLTTKCNFCSNKFGITNWSNPTGKFKRFKTREGTEIPVCEFCENQSKSLDKPFILFQK